MNTIGKAQRGFTLVELMIVVAIIAILAAIALQGYTAYVVRSQVVAGLSDIRGGKAGMEVALNDGHATDVDAAYIGLAAATSRCSSVTAELSEAGVGAIVCTLSGNDEIANADIKLLRASSGFWTCDASAVPSSYRPEGCH